jgi:hypothetical protein
LARVQLGPVASPTTCLPVVAPGSTLWPGGESAFFSSSVLGPICTNILGRELHHTSGEWKRSCNTPLSLEPDLKAICLTSILCQGETLRVTAMHFTAKKERLTGECCVDNCHCSVIALLSCLGPPVSRPARLQVPFRGSCGVQGQRSSAVCKCHSPAEVRGAEREKLI